LLRLIREIHAILLRGGRGANKTQGEFRRSQNWIGGTRPGNAAFVPAPPERMMECLDRFEHFLHDKKHKLPVLVEVGLIHDIDGDKFDSMPWLNLCLVERRLNSKDGLLRKNNESELDSGHYQEHGGERIRPWHCEERLPFCGIALPHAIDRELSRQVSRHGAIC
jgi:hypothetical protein